jgi:hypothetical protein
MANHADNDFRAAAKALMDVVAPALDPQNPLARTKGYGPASRVEW